MKDFSSPTTEAQEEAKKFPNGYVYEIDEKFKGLKKVPAEGIVGAWQVNYEGEIVGVFIPNPNHFSKLS